MRRGLRALQLKGELCWRVLGFLTLRRAAAPFGSRLQNFGQSEPLSQNPPTGTLPRQPGPTGRGAVRPPRTWHLHYERNRCSRPPSGSWKALGNADVEVVVDGPGGRQLRQGRIHKFHSPRGRFDTCRRVSSEGKVVLCSLHREAWKLSRTRRPCTHRWMTKNLRSQTKLPHRPSGDVTSS